MTRQDPTWRLIPGDCIERMRELDEGSVDAVVCDPPYGLGFMGKEWDQARDARAFEEWCEAWGQEALRVLRPGGYLLAFGGTRTYHRLAAGLEDAGFEIRDCIAWLYGSGFPKHASCLKPAHEPIVLARKSSRTASLLNIDACRIATTDDLNGGAYSGDTRKRGEYTSTDTADGAVPLSRLKRGIGEFEQPEGRWPANVVLDEEAASALDEQTGELTSGSGPLNRNADKFRTAYGEFKGGDEPADVLYGDTGGASRFLYVAKPDQAERNVGLPGRNSHPTVKPVALMRWLIRLVTPEGGTVLDPFTGSGTTGIAAMREGYSFIGIEQDADYLAVARDRIIGDAPLLNTFAEEAA